jgi:hypothetical protein
MKMIEAEVWLPVSCDIAFDATVGRAEPLARIFAGAPPLIPTITAARIEDEGPTRAGAVRRVEFSDDNHVREQIVEHAPPLCHRYTMLEMGRTQRALCRDMISTWSFSPADGGTSLRWSCEIAPSSHLSRPLTWLFAWAFGRAMRRALARIGQMLTASHTAGGE